MASDDKADPVQKNKRHWAGGLRIELPLGPTCQFRRSKKLLPCHFHDRPPAAHLQQTGRRYTRALIGHGSHA
jgi:hypothetical protein